MVVLLLGSVALATVPDMYGAGGRLIAMGGGGVAIVQDGAAAHTNPAGLFMIRRPTVTLGFSLATANFEPVPDLWWDTNRDGTIDEADPPLAFEPRVEDAAGLHFSMGRNIGGKFALGLSGYVPTARLLRFSTFEPSLPNYVMYDNRPQRYAFAVGVGGQPVKGLAIGAGIDFVPSARYTVALTVDADLQGTTDPDSGVEELVGEVRVDVHQMDLDLVPGYAPIVGFQLDVGQWSGSLKGLVLAGAYRGSVGLPISVDLDLQANVALEDVGSLDPFVFAAILDAGLALYDHYVPANLSLGAAYKAENTLTAYVDVRNTFWRRMPLNVARVSHADLTSPLVDLDGFVTDGNDFEVTLRNTVGVRTGVEVWLPKWEMASDLEYVRLYVRGGFQFEPSPLVTQGRSSVILDSDRYGFALGMGFETHDPFELNGGPVRIDVFGQRDVLASASLPHVSDVPAAGFPVSGDAIPVGGSLWVVGGQFGFDY